MYKDLFIIMIVLLSLLTLISTLGGSVRFNMERFVPAAPVVVPDVSSCAASSCGGGGGVEHFESFSANDLDIKETYVRLDDAEAEAEGYADADADAEGYAEDEDVDGYDPEGYEEEENAYYAVEGEGEGFDDGDDGDDGRNEEAFQGQQDAPAGFDGGAFGFAEWSATPATA